MEKLDYKAMKDQQLIDIRQQHEYQTGHLKHSLNLNPKNFKKYAEHFLSSNKPIVFIVAEENTEVLEELAAFAEAEDFGPIVGYLSIEDIPNETLETTDTIAAADFLNKDGDYILLDVRHPDEITKPAPEKNLVNIPLEYLAGVHKSLNKFNEVYTLCGSGNRGTSAASYLASKGFKTTVIDGGMKSIQESQ
jgi:rhodanese-related sulfurtransferase